MIKMLLINFMNYPGNSCFYVLYKTVSKMTKITSEL